MSKLPKITLITPSYNQGEFLEECIHSVLSQDYPNLEYIIIDGGSTDNSLEIIKKYETKLSYWLSEPDRGQSDAINKGLRVATGDIINWLNADDFYPPNTLHTVARIFQETQALCVCGRCQVFEDPHKPRHITQGADIYPGNLAKTIGQARTDQPATFYHKKAIAQMGVLDRHLHYLMDRDWWVKFLLYFGLEAVVKTPNILANFRLHPHSKTVSQGMFFNQDRDMYFHALAKKWKLRAEAKFLEDYIPIRKPYHLYCFPEIAEEAFTKKIIHYYLLQKADEYYYQGNSPLATAFLNQIDASILAPPDQALYKKLTWRLRFLPQGLLKIIRSIRG